MSADVLDREINHPLDLFVATTTKSTPTTSGRFSCLSKWVKSVLIGALIHSKHRPATSDRILDHSGGMFNHTYRQFNIFNYTSLDCGRKPDAENTRRHVEKIQTPPRRAVVCRLSFRTLHYKLVDWTKAMDVFYNSRTT